MSADSLIIRHARVVTPEDDRITDVLVENGRIANVGDCGSRTAETEIDAGGKVLFPGLVDMHVHFNDPGRADWEGLDTGSAALAAGGGTTFADMPLNSHPPVLDRETFLAKRARAEAVSRIDFALWGGLTRESLPHLDAMADEGAIGFKAFLCPSGIDEFGAADAEVLREGMKRAAARGLIVGIHAEDPAVIAAHRRENPPPSPGAMRDWFASRPVEAETEAIRRACDIAGETGCRIHIVHVSSREGILEARMAGSLGADVSIETCPHYLLLDEDAGERIGIAAKCAPPLRPAATVNALWNALAVGMIDTIGSDHSPAPPEMKTGDDVFSAWGGIAGCQHGFPLVIGPALERMSWPDLARCFSLAPAMRFGLPGKGAIAPGMDADFVLLEPGGRTIMAGDLLQRHPVSPYLGMTPQWRVVATRQRGQPVTPASRGGFLTKASENP